MTVTTEVKGLFEEARILAGAAMTLMLTGDLREATLKASDATDSAAYALITARSVEAPRTGGGIGYGLRIICEREPNVASFSAEYTHRVGVLFVQCNMNNDFDPIEEVIQLVRETDQFIGDAERLAGEQ